MMARTGRWRFQGFYMLVGGWTKLLVLLLLLEWTAAVTTLYPRRRYAGSQHSAGAVNLKSWLKYWCYYMTGIWRNWSWRFCINDFRECTNLAQEEEQQFLIQEILHLPLERIVIIYIMHHGHSWRYLLKQQCNLVKNWITKTANLWCEAYSI